MPESHNFWEIFSIVAGAVVFLLTLSGLITFSLVTTSINQAARDQVTLKQHNIMWHSVEAKSTFNIRKRYSTENVAKDGLMRTEARQPDHPTVTEMQATKLTTKGRSWSIWNQLDGVLKLLYPPKGNLNLVNLFQRHL